MAGEGGDVEAPELDLAHVVLILCDRGNDAGDTRGEDVATPKRAKKYHKKYFLAQSDFILIFIRQRGFEMN